MLFRVMAYNLYFGGANRVDDIHAVIAHAKPDTVTLTEADDRRVVAELAARLGMEHLWAQGSGDRHIAFLSRFPIAAWRIFNRPPLTQAVLETRLSLSNLQSLISNPHAKSSPSTSSFALTLYSLHLLPYLLLPFELHRARALRALLQIIQRDRPGPHLLLGDLNAVAPGDRVLQHRNPSRMRRAMLLQANLIFRLAVPVLLRAGYVDCYRALHPRRPPLLPFAHAPRERSAAKSKEANGRAPSTSLQGGSARDGGEGKNTDGFTWWTTNPTTRYDYIFADPWFAARLRACRVADDLPQAQTASDHFPLIADFEIEP